MTWDSRGPDLVKSSYLALVKVEIKMNPKAALWIITENVSKNILTWMLKSATS